ncbi:hypothetical protein CR513_46038, partial [Mucuna pruriens]
MTRNHEEYHNYVRDPLEMMLQDYFILTIRMTNKIHQSPVGPKNFELKPALINMNLKKFLYFADTLKINNVIMDTIRLRLFPSLLIDKALKCFPGAPTMISQRAVDLNLLQRSLHIELNQ